MLRLAIIGQAAFGEKVLETVLQKHYPVVGVFCPPDPPEKPSGLKRMGDQHGIPVFQPPKMRDPQVLEMIAHLQPDLNVMAFVTDIVPAEILNCPRLGTIQYHPSLLPKHRGGSAINWAIIQGETRTGLSIFWPDAGIDTGPILLQKEVEIGPDDTTGSLYFNHLFPLGVEAMIEAIDLVQAGNAPRISQDESQATYDPLCKEALTGIDWTLPVEQVYNLVRGANPQPGAHTLFQGSKLKIFDCQRIPTECPVEPGEIWSVSTDGFAVAARGGSLFICRVQPAGGPKTKAGEYALAVGLMPGERLGVG